MKKNQKILLGVAFVAALGLFLYSENKKKKGVGYSNIVGRTAFTDNGGVYGLGCKVCEDSKTKQTYFSNQGECKIGDSCVVSIRPK